MLTLPRGALALAAMLALACSPSLPPVAGCTPGAQRCHDDAPEVCSASQRWEPAGTVPCADVGGVCVVRGAIARCGRAPAFGGPAAPSGDASAPAALDAAAAATDGGAS